jgi:hypothetical protein
LIHVSQCKFICTFRKGIHCISDECISDFEIIKDYFSRGEIGVVGAMYNVETGEVDFFKNLTTQPVLKKALTESV